MHLLGQTRRHHSELEGVFVAQTLKDAQKETAASANHYCKVINDYITGKTGKDTLSRLTEYKLYGAFMEKL